MQAYTIEVSKTEKVRFKQMFIFNERLCGLTEEGVVYYQVLAGASRRLRDSWIPDDMNLAIKTYVPPITSGYNETL